MILVSSDKIDEYTCRGWWGTTTLWDLFRQNLHQRPQAEAVVDAINRADFAHGAPQRLTWSRLAEAVDRFCHLLLELGMRRDAVLLMQQPNCVEQFVVYMACARLGIIVTPVPTQYRENELHHILESTHAAAVVTFTRIGKPGGGHASAEMFAQKDRRAVRTRWRPSAVLPLCRALQGSGDPRRHEHLGGGNRRPAAGMPRRARSGHRRCARRGHGRKSLCLRGSEG